MDPKAADGFQRTVVVIEVALILIIVPFVLIGMVLFAARIYLLYRSSKIPEFHRKRVLVTGADTGFGRQVVMQLVKRRVIVYAGCATKEGGHLLLKDTQDTVRILDLDVTNRETLEQARDFIEKDLPPGEGLWGLVNSACTMRGVLFDFCTERDFRDVMEANFFGTIRAVEVFAPLIRRDQGRIVNLNAGMGRVWFGTEPYVCSYDALNKYNDGLRRSMKSFDVHVAIVDTGFYSVGNETEQTLVGEFDRTWEQMSQELKEEYGQEYHRDVRRHLKEINKTNHVMTSFLQKSSGVPKTIVHALSSTRPKDRYHAGVDAYAYTWIMALIPCWLHDLAMAPVLKYSGMERQQH